MDFSGDGHPWKQNSILGQPRQARILELNGHTVKPAGSRTFVRHRLHIGGGATRVRFKANGTNFTLQAPKLLEREGVDLDEQVITY